MHVAATLAVRRGPGRPAGPVLRPLPRPCRVPAGGPAIGGDGDRVTATAGTAALDGHRRAGRRAGCRRGGRPAAAPGGRRDHGARRRTGGSCGRGRWRPMANRGEARRPARGREGGRDCRSGDAAAPRTIAARGGDAADARRSAARGEAGTRSAGCRAGACVLGGGARRRRLPGAVPGAGGGGSGGSRGGRRPRRRGRWLGPRSRSTSTASAGRAAGRRGCRRRWRSSGRGSGTPATLPATGSPAGSPSGGMPGTPRPCGHRGRRRAVAGRFPAGARLAVARRVRPAELRPGDRHVAGARAARGVRRGGGRRPAGARVGGRAVHARRAPALGGDDASLHRRACFEAAAGALVRGIAPRSVLLTAGDTGERLRVDVDAGVLAAGGELIVDVVRQRVGRRPPGVRPRRRHPLGPVPALRLAPPAARPGRRGWPAPAAAGAASPSAADPPAPTPRGRR